MKPCVHPGCNELVNGSRCSRHAKQLDRSRGTARGRGYTHDWEKERAEFLRQNPWCAIKGSRCSKRATVVDHRIPHRGDMKLFWDRLNWQPACKPCHDSDKQREEKRAAAPNNRLCTPHDIRDGSPPFTSERPLCSHELDVKSTGESVTQCNTTTYGQYLSVESFRGVGGSDRRGLQFSPPRNSLPGRTVSRVGTGPHRWGNG